MTDVIKEIDALMSAQLMPELMDWKRRQQIACIGGPLLTGLDQLQYWYHSLLTLLHCHYYDYSFVVLILFFFKFFSNSLYRIKKAMCVSKVL